MLEGLRDVEEDLNRRGIKFVVRRGSPDEVALEAGKDASLIVTDRGYMRPQKRWREKVAGEAGCPLVQVETDVVVPVELASDKQEHAARTLRPRIHEYLDDFLVELEPTEVRKQSLNMGVDGLNLSDIESLLNEMDLDRSVEPVSHLYRGGTSAAKEILEDFVKNRFDDYVEHRNQPQTDDVSHMSKYLHYGHVSPIYLALEVKRAGAGQHNVDSYLEEVVVRRELSMNLCHFTPAYDSFSCLPDWAKETLKAHRSEEHTSELQSRQYLVCRLLLEKNHSAQNI